MPEFMMLWRLIATTFSFVLFGISGLLVGLLICPLLFFAPIGKRRKRIATRELVTFLFRSFVYIMKYMGILTFDLHGFERIRNQPNVLMVANHPTLIDVVFIIGFTRRLNCIVKWGVWRNPVMHFIVKSAGYLHNNRSAGDLVDQCAGFINGGDGLIVFPEGTRTVMGEDMKLRRGAAQIALQAGINVTPVRISCVPLFLSKQQKWYYVPRTKPHIKMTVCDDIVVKPYQGVQKTIAVRKITALIKHSFGEEATYYG